MMPILLAVAGFALGWWLMQLIFCFGYRRAMGRSPESAPEIRWPRVVVLFPVRGFDETLLTAIRCVAAVDYPDFTVQILFDSREDAAWELVQAELAQMRDPRFSTQVFESHSETCGLVCSNFVAAVDQLDDQQELIAFCASDMIVSRNWLKAMARAMAGPAAGTTLGNRWYEPPAGSAGGIVRWMWNAGAVVMMRWCRIPWSGGMALRLSEVRHGGLRELWATSMVEDVSVAAHFAADLRRLRFVPELIVMDRDGIPLRKAYRFILRQLLWTRLYSPRWLLVAGNALCGTLASLAPLVLAVAALATGAHAVAALSLLTFAVYTVGMALLMPIVTSGVARATGEPLRPFAGLSIFAMLIAIPLTQVVYFAACCGAAFTRTVEWRGIHYRINGPQKIRRLDYQAYTADRERP